MKIKSLIAITTVILLASCGAASDKVEIAKAKDVCEKTITAIDKGEFDNVKDNYYSTEFSAGTSKEDLTGKFTKLKEACGDLVSYTLKDSSSTAEIGFPAQAVLTYEVKHSKVTTTEKFVVINQFDSYRISSHSVNN
ncbi:MAG: hypothetical protein IAF38_01050 [Bacteroidia bacterium]|nr:hypothetical protein [Bacteroidia bacterium]